MRKLLLASVFIASSSMAVSMTASAQSTPIPPQDDHAGHDHAQAAPDRPIPDIDFVFSEAPDDHVLGADTAPITLIVYASVTCSHCGNWFTNEWPVVKSELIDAGKIRFVMRALPTPPAVMSMTGFLMAECAPAESYFDVIQYQMENQKEMFEAARAGKGQEAYAKVGKLAGLNSDEEINGCLGNKENMAHIQASGLRADAAKVKGVPAFYIGGDLYEGDQSASALVKLFDDMLEAGQTSLPQTLVD